jgi:Stress responsive A/B Barrel Domain
MIRHVLLLQPAPHAEPEAIEACRRAITGLVGRIPGLSNCHWGENFAPPERRDGFTHAFSMDFVDRQSLDAYAPHPEHLPAAKLVRATFERIVVLDFEL